MKAKVTDLTCKILLISFFVSLTYLDIHTTMQAIEYESNQIVSVLIEKNLFHIVKYVSLIPIIIGVCLFDKTNGVIKFTFSAVSVVWICLMIYVVINNFYVLELIKLNC